MSEDNAVHQTTQDNEEGNVGEVQTDANQFFTQWQLSSLNLPWASTKSHGTEEGQQTKDEEKNVEGEGYEGDVVRFGKGVVKPGSSDNVNISAIK